MKLTIVCLFNDANISWKKELCDECGTMAGQAHKSELKWNDNGIHVAGSETSCSLVYPEQTM